MAFVWWATSLLLGKLSSSSSPRPFPSICSQHAVVGECKKVGSDLEVAEAIWEETMLQASDDHGGADYGATRPKLDPFEALWSEAGQ